MQEMNNIFYAPEEQYPDMPHGEMCGDIMPFFWEGKFILIYLYKYCIYAVETTDFVHYGQHRLVLQNGSPDEQDWHAATGSVVRANDMFYFYYTGFCEGNRGKKGKFEQQILRASSKDLIYWEKDRTYAFAPDERFYGGVHWRDPHVFYHDELEKYCMLVTATDKDGECQRSGCTAVYESEDALSWTHRGTLYAPRTYVTHECHDVFRMNGMWYLIFSNYSRQWETRYRYSESFSGPWMPPPEDDMFDGRELYAAKTVTDGEKRYLIGWQSIRRGCSDQGQFVWGGNVLVHELIQREDGTLGVRMPEGIYASFCLEKPLQLTNKIGSWYMKDQRLQCTSVDGFAWSKLGDLNGTCMFEADLKWVEGTHVVGLMIHTSGERLEKWCQLRIEIQHRRIVMDRSNRIDGDQTYMDERPIHISNNSAHVQLITQGNIMLVYVDDVALTTRCYEIIGGGLGLFVEYGMLEVTNMHLKKQNG